MVSFRTVRNPADDHLLTPQNAAMVIIDFQPVQVSSIQSRPKRELVANVTALARIAALYELPTVLSCDPACKFDPLGRGIGVQN